MMMRRLGVRLASVLCILAVLFGSASSGVLHFTAFAGDTETDEITIDDETPVDPEKTGWQYENEKWYYYNEAGEMQTGWLKINNKWYFFDENGEMQTGWLLDSDKWYFLNENGAMQTGWLLRGNTWYLLSGSGDMLTGWQKVGNKWYYLDPVNGDMKTGWLNESGKWYFLNARGEMQTGWLLRGYTWYLLSGSGAMLTGWQKVGNTWYYLDPVNGDMKTGWLNESGKWYFLNARGEMQTGWLLRGYTWYLLNGSGVMQTGWVQLANKWYYLSSSGAMLTGVHKIDGVVYLLENNGVYNSTGSKAVQYAYEVFSAATNSSMTKQQKLRACFNYMVDTRHFTGGRGRVPYYNKYDWPQEYTLDMKRDRSSTCHGYSALFGYLAMFCGYTNVHWCNNAFHAWVDVDGYIYDPVFVNSSYRTEVFGITYSTGRAWDLGAGYRDMSGEAGTWMYIKAPIWYE